MSDRTDEADSDHGLGVGVSCPDCDGYGEDEEGAVCERCDGTGVVTSYLDGHTD